MLQTIVYEDPIPTRLLLNHHSTRTAVPAWRYDSPHLVFTEASEWLGILVACHPAILPSPELRAEAQEEEATAFSPRHPSFVPGVRGQGGNGKDVTRDASTVSPGGRKPRHVVGVTARPLQLTHGAHSACVHTGDPDEFKPDYMSQALAGQWV
jgi:hypothetical protein